MTDDAIRFDLFPEPVRKRVAEIDTEIDGIERERAALEEMIQDFVAEKGRKTAIREAIIETAQMFVAALEVPEAERDGLRIALPASIGDSIGNGIVLNSMSHPKGDRQRRDIRGLVLEHLRQIQPGGATATEIADKLRAALRSVDKALAHHEAAGAVVRDGDIWRIPVAEPVEREAAAPAPPEPPLDTMKVAVEAGLVPPGTRLQAPGWHPGDPPPTAEHVLDFITRLRRHGCRHRAVADHRGHPIGPQSAVA